MSRHSAVLSPEWLKESSRRYRFAPRKTAFTGGVQTYVRTLEMLTKRQAGEPIDTPSAPSGPVSTPVGDSPRLSEVFEVYKADKSTLAPKTIADFSAQLRRFIELHGDLPVKSVTRTHIREFKDALARFPARPDRHQRKMTLPQILAATKDDPDIKRLSPKTINEKALASLSAILGWAAKQTYRDDNPALRLKIKGAKVEATGLLPVP